MSSSKPFIFDLLSAIPSSPVTEQHVSKEVVMEEHLAFVHLIDSNATSSKKDVIQENRGLGTWVFDKKTRKRRYVSLTGKNFTGAPAIEQILTLTLKILRVYWDNLLRFIPYY
jgi:hypothetical protein